ncbi:MAG: transporter [Gammaproteobacteria bacterium RIFCSPLOWO2_02_FULL_57_10]|nr:MAG: transporter [Gammaproteobacteria bacterium RIFCSPLOWO2_02_FULL_57_10]
MNDENNLGESPTRLSRKLTTFNAVVIGLGAMVGAGIFAVVGPAAQIAGSGLLPALLLAAVLAYCNAASSAQLAALYPESGGAYVYGRKKLGDFWGFLAGWGFIVGKTASCAAMALTFASYAAPDMMRPLAVFAVLALTVVNYFGVKKTALLTRLIVVLVLVALAIVIFAVLFGGQIDATRLLPDESWGFYPILQAAGLWFFAFAGYARLATLGEEVAEPRRTIPRAIPLALGIALLLYLIVAISALMAVDITTLAGTSAPLAAAVEAGSMSELSVAVRFGAAIASLGVLLSLIVGVSRTSFAMATNRDLPPFLEAVHPRYKVPHRAELLVGVVVALVVSMADLRSAIGFSSFTVLTYYAITNASALRLTSRERLWPRWISMAGLSGCIVLAFCLPGTSVVGGALVLMLGAAWFAVRQNLRKHVR